MVFYVNVQLIDATKTTRLGREHDQFATTKSLIDKMHTMSYTYYMEGINQHYHFSAEKNQQLIRERGISFEEVIAAIEEGALLDILPHPNPARYPNQKIYVLNINNYVCLVPFVMKDNNTIFLKTIFPHRKLTKQYLRGKQYAKEKT